MGLKAGNWASRQRFRSQGLELDLKTGIWASRLGFEWTEEKKKEEEEEEEKQKSPHMCESIAIICPYLFLGSISVLG